MLSLLSDLLLESDLPFLSLIAIGLTYWVLDLLRLLLPLAFLLLALCSPEPPLLVLLLVTASFTRADGVEGVKGITGYYSNTK